ncbi:MAG: hypothetical protein UX85_C0007G0024 [Candidatus Beckwithbacteria bacterium GW2011_GWB1_47_15]|uniref:Uncharacterized protein n=1 Tax=Candidatus Beckwithbacteria bacterium GW2011_GWB1_47_15 TaxID=1618371 RepID=A0A0G1RUD1_9BACT|nr:MAG: hypothetical protein UY43_C0001G0557 [Candidatus Beckwithbacteria bacterium GW2011_GWC1_49_16]KKU35093.1 MAG: hypothetical protein UX50_C0006G0019 [Candidatus Beckwithbacteria bacterium GW2011_GWA1_46_30]KKU60737.1 MAG: hypothetical protein UX85_C0007G0024 [Candidatus Beckwithbacteria bacterium GW2011_GWB1_47_15]KKU71542.1 MAG: hypothetical protein UX97_C0005G0025 [Candidatus Beckwithbacteria bacterium GW2011_GWA2_47_25]KKW03505.1 MAG: hypothetical protein UY37_C0005G0068 [Candidatus Be
MKDLLHQSPIELTTSQKELAVAVLDIFQNSPTDNKQLVIIEGFRGIGKTTLVNHLQQITHQSEVYFFSEDDITYYNQDAIKELSNHTRAIFTGRPLSFQNDSVYDKNLKKLARQEKFKIHHRTLKGMTETEMDQFLDRAYLEGESSLSRDTVHRYSLGIPTLATMLSWSGVTEDMVVFIAGRYLKNNLGRETKPFKYLSYELIPQDVLDKVEQLRDVFYSIRGKKFGDYLSGAVLEQERLKNKGVVHEDPVFVAPESYKIYDEILQSDGPAEIDVFAPNISDYIFRRVLGVIGPYAYYTPENRSKMFEMEMRKVSIWHSDRNNFISTGVNYLDNEYYGIEKAGDNFVYAYQQGLLGIPVFSKKNNSFLIHAHAHFDEVENPAMVGYMTESLFQQLGIAYFVYSGTLNKSYWYNPEVRHIVMLDQPVAVGKFDISVGSKRVWKVY